MASDRRSSISSLKSAISRTSMGSGRPSTPPSTAERRPHSPLTQPAIGVPTLAPPPAVGKGGLAPPMTPQRKAIQRQKSPLSAEAFSSPAPSMPGSFPEESPAVDPTEGLSLLRLTFLKLTIPKQNLLQPRHRTKTACLQCRNSFLSKLSVAHTMLPPLKALHRPLQL